MALNDIEIVVVNAESTRAFADAKSGETWKRGGSCSRCGQCCTGNFITGEDKVDCHLLVRGKDGLCSCSDRASDHYLTTCVDWPTHPDQIWDKPGCTYTFEKV